MRTKTEDVIALARKAFLNKSNFNYEPVSYSTLAAVLQEASLHKMVLYHFIHSGCMNKIKRGLYRFNSTINTLSDKDIIHNSQYNMTKKRGESLRIKFSQNKYIKKTESIHNIDSINERQAIDYLKQRGYKIMKSIQEYREI